MHSISQHVLGKQALFFPASYGKNANEPADLVWVINRCAILMYMTAGKKTFEKKCKHNLRQLGRWLKAWKRGEPLCGTADSVDYHIGFEDVDHIIGLSVVSDGEIYCEYHPDSTVYFKGHQLSACATVTGSVIRELAAIGAGPRDLIYWLRILRDARARLSESEMLRSIRENFDTEILTWRAHFSRIAVWSRYREFTINSTVRFFAELKTSSTINIGDFSSFLSELTLADIAWLAFASAALESQIVGPGEHGPLVVYAKRDAGPFKLQCLTAASVRLLSENIHRILHPGPGLSIMCSFDFGKRNPLLMYALHPRVGPSLMEQELAALSPNRE